MVISVIVLMLLIGYAIYNKISNKHEPVVVVPTDSLAYLTINKQDQSETPKFTLDVEYPEFRGLGKLRDEALNSFVATTIASHIEQFKSEAREVKPFQEGASTLSIHFEMKNSSDRLVSMVFKESSYIAGAAHPNDFIYTITYNPTTNSPIALSDLFKKDGKYLSFVAPLVKEKMLGNPQLAGVVTSPWIEEGTSEKVENFNAFTLSPHGLTIYFNPYQVAAYAAGVLEVTIPFSELESQLDKQGVVSVFLQ